MKYIVVCLLILIPIFCFSQNLQNLDLKYGFNKFKLESSILDYERDLKYESMDNKTGTVYYTYVKKDINIFGYNEVEEIGLGFYKEKLYTISIYINPINKDYMYNTVFTKLKELFGPPTVRNSGEDFGENDSRSFIDDINQWKTNNTVLGLNKIKCNSILFPCRINIFLVSQRLKRQMNSDGF